MFLFTTCSGVWNGWRPFANGDIDAADAPFEQACWKCIELNCCITSAFLSYYRCPICLHYVSKLSAWLLEPCLDGSMLPFNLFCSIFANAFWNSSGSTLSIIASLWAVRVARIHCLDQCVLASLIFVTMNSGSAHFGSRFVALRRNRLRNPSIMVGVLFATIRRFFNKPTFFWSITNFGLHEYDQAWALGCTLLSVYIIHSVSSPSVCSISSLITLSSSSASIADSRCSSNLVTPAFSTNSNVALMNFVVLHLLSTVNPQGLLLRLFRGIFLHSQPTSISIPKALWSDEPPLYSPIIPTLRKGINLGGHRMKSIGGEDEDDLLHDKIGQCPCLVANALTRPTSIQNCSKPSLMTLCTSGIVLLASIPSIMWCPSWSRGVMNSWRSDSIRLWGKHFVLGPFCADSPLSEVRHPCHKLVYTP